MSQYKSRAGSTLTYDQFRSDVAAGRLPQMTTGELGAAANRVNYISALGMTDDQYNTAREYPFEATARLGREEQARLREELQMNKLAQRNVTGAGGSNTAVVQKPTLG